jgi:tetratricopeptide (TPR) repeat protein
MARCLRWMALLVVASPLHSEPLTYNRDIAPIVARNCAPCHRPGESGPFPLLTYEDVHKRAAQIAAVTHSRYMPPWLPEHGYGDFADELRLTDRQIRTIADWVAQGAPRGEGESVSADALSSPLGKPDLVIQAERAFTVPASGGDLYWNFVFRPAIDRTRYVRAVEIVPGNRQVVHHANLLVDRMASQPAAGFAGMDLAIMRSPFDPDGNFLFWKPGSAPHVEPDGFAWRLDPGNELVLNVHMHPSGKSEEVWPSVALYFTDRAPSHFPLLVQLENDIALDIPAGARDFTVADDFPLPLDADILAVYPHAHYLGKLLEAYATLPDGKRKWLVRIPDWDPDWQAVYYYREPVFLPKGSVISMRYHYDNSPANVRNPNHPPRRVAAGNQSADEMAHLWLEVLPRGAGDHRRELQEAVMQHRLARDPDDFTARMNLGAVMLSRLRPQEAVGMLETAVRLDPARAEARNMLGLALMQTGRAREAVAQFSLAVKANPDFFGARVNLAAVELKLGALDDAIVNLRILAAAQPENETIRKRLAEAIEARGGK